ncbi:MAG TPA: HIT family protein, partial [Pyrinomonadaceae bacterium]|nr:HIT family protein [Pyrinomonadaceae bacterium]
MKSNPTCIFCKIVERTAEASVIYEDDQIMAFMTLRQINPGEFLIIPKQHIDHFCDIADGLSCHIITHAQRLSRNLRERFKPQRVGLVVHGYGVPHAHLVVVPLHDASDIVSAKYAYIEDGQIKFSEDLVPEEPRSELDRLAKVL